MPVTSPTHFFIIILICIISYFFVLHIECTLNAKKKKIHGIFIGIWLTGVQ